LRAVFLESEVCAVETLAMTGPKKGKPKGRDPNDIVVLSMKCRREWRTWAMNVARAERASLATLIDQLLTERARERQLPAPPSRGGRELW
jgi:hypothetical protein